MVADGFEKSSKPTRPSIHYSHDDQNLMILHGRNNICINIWGFELVLNSKYIKYWDFYFNI